MENMDVTQVCELSKNKPTILIQTFKAAENFLSLQKTLEDIQPSFIVMYHSNMTAIRQLEVSQFRSNFYYTHILHNNLYHTIISIIQ